MELSKCNVRYTCNLYVFCSQGKVNNIVHDGGLHVGSGDLLLQED